MVDSTRMGSTYIAFVFYMINFVTTFNIDTKNPYIYNNVPTSNLSGSADTNNMPAHVPAILIS